MRYRRLAIGAALGTILLGGGAVAFAAGGEGCWRGAGGWHGHAARAGMGWGPGPGPLCGEERSERMEDLLAVVEGWGLFDEAQQVAWEELKARLRAGDARMSTACGTLREGDAATTPAARLGGMEAMLEAGLATVREVAPAFDAFYETLRPEQRAVVERLMRHRHG